MDKYITIDFPYKRIVLEMSPEALPSTPVLDDLQWDALRTAENRLYNGEYGAHAYTSVVHRCEGHDAARFWSIAQNPVDDQFENEYEGDLQDLHVPDNVRNARIARRVAAALAVLNFGSDFLLKS
jgi:hypothetical protein